jgi:hypothetical protein
MKTRTARLMRTAANWLYRLATKLDPPAPLPVIEPKSSGLDDLEFVQRMANQMDLNTALHTALRRYSPTETPGQC